MADQGYNIFSNPALVELVQREGEDAQAWERAAGSATQSLAYGGAQSAGTAMNALGNMMGMPQQRDPRIEQALKARQIVQSVQGMDYEAQMKRAEQLHRAGFINEAELIKANAVEQKTSEQIAQSQYNNSLEDSSKSFKEFKEWAMLNNIDPESAKKYWELINNKGGSKTEINNNPVIGGREKSPLTTSQEGKVQEKVMGIDDTIARLDQLEADFDKRFLQIPTKIGKSWDSLKEKWDIGELTTEEEQDLSDYASFRAGAYENINLYIKYITGAQMSEAEAKRLRRVPADVGDGWFDGDSQTVFLSKLRKQKRDLKAVRLRNQVLLSEGVDLGKAFAVDKDGKTIDKSAAETASSKYNVYEAIKAQEALDEIGKRVMDGNMTPQQAEINTQRIKQTLLETYGFSE